MIANLILLTGSDTYRLGQRLRFYRRAFREKYPNSEVEDYDKNTEFSAIQNAVFTQSLFLSKKLIIGDEFWTPETFELAVKTDFFKKLPDFNETSTLICVHSALDKRKKFSKFLLKEARVETFDPLGEAQTVQWIMDFVAQRSGVIKYPEAQYLTQRCGDNGWNLHNEMEKLIASANNTPISKSLIDMLTIPHPKVIIWGFLESLSQKKTKLTLNYFRQLSLMGESVHQILAMLIREIRIHAQITFGISQNLPAKEIASRSGLHPYVVQKTMPLSRNFTLPQIQQLYDQLFEIDQRIKTGKIMISTDDQSELELAIERFILSATT